MENADDSLHVAQDSEILKVIGDDDKVLLSVQVIKVNRYGLSQERNMIVTKKNIYNFKRKSKYIHFYNF